jgi:hypothetical protein
VHLSYDFGQRWIKAQVKSPRNSSGPQRFTVEVKLPKRATTRSGPALLTTPAGFTIYINEAFEVCDG